MYCVIVDKVRCFQVDKMFLETMAIYGYSHEKEMTGIKVVHSTDN